MVQSVTLENNLAIVYSYEILHFYTIYCINLSQSIYTKEMKTNAHTKMCTQMFIAAFFLTHKNWRHTKNLSTDE